jgi:hypothetical protein
MGYQGIAGMDSDGMIRSVNLNSRKLNRNARFNKIKPNTAIARAINTL